MIPKLITTCFFTLSLLASNLSVNVNLSPAGSFEIKSDSIKGAVSKSGNIFKADKISVPVKSFSTGLDLRDKHTKEKLNYKKYPSIKITDATANNGKGRAKIKIMDVEKEINFNYIERNKVIEIKFQLLLSDFKIQNISYMGIGVSDIVDIIANVDVL